MTSKFPIHKSYRFWFISPIRKLKQSSYEYNNERPGEEIAEG
jgi:hypothetical protein